MDKASTHLHQEGLGQYHYGPCGTFARWRMSDMKAGLALVRTDLLGTGCRSPLPVWLSLPDKGSSCGRLQTAAGHLDKADTRFAPPLTQVHQGRPGKCLDPFGQQMSLADKGCMFQTLGCLQQCQQDRMHTHPGHSNQCGGCTAPWRW